MKKLLSILTVSVFFIGMYLFIYLIFIGQKEDGPSALNGKIDIEMNDIKYGEIPLVGEWQFIKNELYTPVQFQSSNHLDSIYTNVWGNWKNLMDSKSGYGSGTYRLIINMNDQELLPVYGLKTTSIQMAHKMYLNGKLIAQVGNPSKNSDYIPGNRPYTVFFPLQKGENELVIEVANYIYPPSGGLNFPIYFGMPDDITALKDNKIAQDWILVAIFIFMSLYFFGVFFQWRRNRYLLFFSGICLGIGLYIFSHGEKVIYFVLPHLSYASLLRIQYFSLSITIITLFAYLLTAHKKYASPKLIIPLITTCIIMLIYDLVFIETVPNFILILHTIMGIIAIVYAAYIFQLAYFHKDKEGLFLLLAIYSISFYVLATNMNAYTNNYIDNWLLLTPFGTLLMFSLLLSMRFADSFKENEELSLELIRMNRVKDEFFERTTHEFLTPISGLHHISESMLKNISHEDHSEWRKNVELINSLSIRMSVLVRDIKDFVNLKQGLIKVEKTTVDSYSVIEIEKAIFEIMAEQKNIRLINNIPRDFPYITADVNRFRQIISNLLDNALKYSYSGEVVLSSKWENDRIFFHIADNGIGIPEEKLLDIQLMFENQESDDIQGLGLRIVKQLLDLQDGKIQIKSEEGKGTIVQISFPIANHAQHVKYERSTTKKELIVNPFNMEFPYYTKGEFDYTILMVDDDISSLKIMIDIIESIPAKVIAVNDGKEALLLLKKHPKVDLVISDLVMPNVSGFELSKQIRETHSLVDLPLLMVIDSSYQADRMNILHMGANDSITKPFHSAEFEARVKNLLMMREAVNQSIKMEVAFLQSQIKPHFLFNVLNTIIALSYTDVEKSREVTENFADYLRSSFDFHNTNTLIPFNKELQLVQSYVEIEKVRFYNRFKMTYDIQVKGSFMVPPLIIQPIIENAIRHGIGKKVEGGEVKLTVVKIEEKILISIQDNGIGLSKEMLESLKTNKKEEGHVGLKNINQRLKYYYGSELVIRSEVNKGTTVEMTIY